MILKVPVLLCACCVASPVFAQGEWTAGLLADGGQSPYVGGEDGYVLIPYIAFDTDRLHIGVDGLSYILTDRDDLAVSVTLDPRFAPVLPDTPLFDGLTRDTAFELGVEATYDIQDVTATVSLQYDVSGVHDGFAADVSLGYERIVRPFLLGVTAGLQFHDANLNTYLYGVAPSEVTADRAAFDMGDTVTAFAEVYALMPVSESGFLLGEVRYIDLGNASDSPLVERNAVSEVTLGLLFQF